MHKHFVIFVAVWLNLCNNNNPNFFIALIFVRSLVGAENLGLWPQFSKASSGPGKC